MGEHVRTDEQMTDQDACACEWSDYRKEYGVNASEFTAAYKAFTAGWDAARGKSLEGIPQT